MIGRPTLVLALAAAVRTAAAQNVVDGGSTVGVAEPVALAETALPAIVNRVAVAGKPAGRAAERVAAKLDAHVAEFLAGRPWKAFHNTLGISGYEAYFSHPDRMYYSLALALPYLSPATAEKTRAFLAEQLKIAPPYRQEGPRENAGRAREAYEVPDAVRAAGFALNKGNRAADVFGVYSFWLYCRNADADAAKAHWGAVKDRLRPLLEKDYAFDIRKRDYRNDEAERLTGDLAGLIAAVRLARLNGDGAAEMQAAARAARLLELRVNLDRVNPRILEATNSSTAHLHVSKLARYGNLVPEAGAALRAHTDGLAAGRLAEFRRARNGWYLAFPDRLTGGENYTTPPHVGRAVFAGAALVEEVPAEELLSWIDVPWCRGDLYFIEKCALALWAASGRPWSP
jgi:hypothetical protein